MGPRPADRQARHAGSSTAIRSSKEFGCGAWLPQYSKALPILSRYGQKATSGCIGQRDRQLRERPSFIDTISYHWSGKRGRAHLVGARRRRGNDEPIPRGHDAPPHRAWIAGIAIRVRLYGGAARGRKAPAAAQGGAAGARVPARRRRGARPRSEPAKAAHWRQVAWWS